MTQLVTQQAFDLIVIGGGINGAGVARDGALRGLKTLIIDKADFCGGTTSWSTRLIHGGLRYLEYFEFALVRESLKEREILLSTAPHLVDPLLLTIPVYGDRSRPYWKIQAGMLLYDLFSYDKTLPTHRMLPKAKFRQLFRHIDPDGLKGGAQYYDAQVAYAERLALENIISAEAAGATVLNYVEVSQLHRRGDRITGLGCKDVITGETYDVQTSENGVVINTSGPWVDAVLKCGDEDGKAAPIGTTRKIGGTKGSHIIVEPFPGAPQESALYVEAKSDGRPFFIVPFLGMVLIGTTDLRYTGNLDVVKADDDEIDYLLKETNLIIPTAQLNREDIKFTYSGVRPLPYSDSKSTSGITRSHILYDHTKEGATNLISLIGGKITTYRQVGEEAVDQVYRKQGRTAPPCSTRKRPLPGAILPSDSRVQDAIAAYQDRLSVPTLDHLFDIYGARTLELLALVDEHPELAEPIAPPLFDIKAQVVFAANTEYARTLVDITRRRTSLAMRADYGLPLLPLLSDLLQRYCGWSAAECAKQATYYSTFMRDNCIPDYAVDQYSQYWETDAPVSATR